jgi:aryl-alcohol dehydrogenase-like predicted oxidoreductase
MLAARRFGRTDLFVSPLGLGTVKFGRNTGVKYPTAFALPDDRQARDLLVLAGDLGINLLDTAPAYGTSEERLGPLLAGQRDRWVICTKVGEEFDTATGASRFDFTPAHIRASIERSLARLRTDVLDIVLVHSDGNDTDIIRRQGALETLAMLKAEGKIRATGMSTKTVAGGLLALDHADCAMVTYNRVDTADLPVIESAAARGQGILIKKPLQSGHLADTAGEDPVRAGFRHIFAQPGIGAAITGTLSPDHLRANAAACAEALAARTGG